MKKTFTMSTRITAVMIGIVVCCCCLLQSAIVNAQNPKEIKLTISFKNETLSGALMKLEVASKHPFSYDKNALSQVKVADISFTQETLDKILDKLLAGTGQSYEVLNKNIVIAKQPSKSPNVQAGQGPGTIKGRIVEFETSQPLPGASVYIVELQKGMTSDNNGFYRFTNVPAGIYTVKVSYISYKTESVQVEIKAGKEETYDVKMQGNNALSEVVVTGVGKTRKPVAHTTERQVLQEIKSAQSVVSGISSQEISRSADRNVAEVVRRISGVSVKDDKFIVIRGMNERYNLTYLNGNIAPSTEQYSRAFALDLLPTRIIDRIMVYKSPAPDLMGDMTGGAVKIYTKDAKNVKHFDLELQTGVLQNTTLNGNFLTYQGGKFDFLGFDDGTRKLPSSVPGFGDFTRASISQKQYAHDFTNILNYGKKTAIPPIQLTANYYDSYRIADRSLSMLSSLSYKNELRKLNIERTSGNLTIVGNGEPTTILGNKGTDDQNTENAQLSLLQNFTYHWSDSTNFYFKNFVLQQGQNSTILRNRETNLYFVTDKGWDRNNSPRLRDIILSYNQRFLYSGNLGSNTVLGSTGKHTLNWNLGYTYSKLSTPDQRVIHLQNGPGLGTIPIVGDIEQNWVPKWREQDFEDSGNALERGMISRVWIRNAESLYNGSIDYAWKLRTWATFKAGTYQQWKERSVFRRVFTVNEGDLNSFGQPVDPFNNAIGALNPDMDMNLVIWRQQDLGKLWSNAYLRDDGTALKVYDRTKGGDAYTATEQNNSGYLALSLLPFGSKLDIYGGVRLEYNRQKVAGALGILQDAPGGVNTPVLADLKSTEVLPSLNIGYRPSETWVLRGGYGKTVNRPEFRELSPYQELDYLENQQIRGNSKLQVARIDNYDIRLECYPGKKGDMGETISLGGFYKKIQHPIERVIARENYISGASNIQFMNADKADVFGVELDVRKDFSFIPGKFFRDLSFVANASYIHSEALRTPISSDGITTLTDPLIRRQLQGQSPYLINAGLYYENAGSGTRAGFIFNQTGPRIYAAAIGHAAYKNEGMNYPELGTQPSLLELRRRQLDFSITQRIGKGLQLKLAVQNILNDAIQLAEDANFTYKYEKAQFIPKSNGTIYSYVSGDLLSTDYRPGRYFISTLTYAF